MLSEGVGVGEVVLELPEDILVVGDVALVGIANPSAEVDLRFVALTLAVAYVETYF